jgi:hypothetical protein
LSKLFSFYYLDEEKENYEKLLEAMQSEKSALSRAMQQNKDLKDQLSVLEDAYIKQTNTNADLLNQLQAQQHYNKQLNATLNLKDNEINSFKNNNDESTKLQNAIDVIEKTTSIIDGDKLNQDWDDEDTYAKNTFSDNNTTSNFNTDSSSSNYSDVERIVKSYNELIGTLNEKDSLISQLNNELNELKVSVYFKVCQ